MANRTPEQLSNIATRSTKEHQLEIAKKWGIPADVLAGATFGLGVTMMFESGHSEDQIIEMLRGVMSDLTGSPTRRGAS
jgi:hypothetical protein